MASESIAHEAEWAIGSEPIRDRGIIVNYCILRQNRGVVIKCMLCYVMSYSNKQIQSCNAKRWRQRERQKIAIVLISKKKACKCSTLFCTFIWRCFARWQRETSQLNILYRKWRMCSPKFLLLVSLVAFFFHCRSLSPRWPLAFLIFSPPSFMFFFQRNSSLLFCV